MTDEKCLFCKIARGELPSQKVYEDEDVYAFLDIKPVSPGHTLVIPKRHFTSLYELSDEIIGHLFMKVRDISIAAKKGLNADGINLEMNNDGPAGQIIYHAHIHIVPRFSGDGLRHWPGKDISMEELAKTAEKIKNRL